MSGAHGLVIGKFYPPHAGHHRLIRAAAAACGRVSVIVMAASHESIPLQARVQWLTAEHTDDAHVVVTGIVDDVAIDYGDTEIWAQHVALMHQALAAINAPSVTAVFSSEPYGAELARRFDARAVLLDLDRKLTPVSGTQVRADPAAHWESLAAPVRAGLALRVVVVGAESSGSTTLSRDLAAHWRAQGNVQGNGHALTRWVPEYGRDYTAQKWADARARAQLAGQAAPLLGQLQWESSEFVHIARTQARMEEEAARGGGPLLVCDTDAYATAIWHERYLGAPSAEVLRLAAPGAPRRLYLLTDHVDVPFEQDGIRDGEALRPWMTGRFAEALHASGADWRRLRGSRLERLEQAAALSAQALRQAWRFAPPLPPAPEP